MKWVPRGSAKTDRVAYPWLIKKFINPQAEFLLVPKDEVLEVPRREGAKSFDCPGADYTDCEGKCSFEVLVGKCKVRDPALQVLARIVNGADVSTDVGIVPEAVGLQAVAHGFAAICSDDHQKLDLEFPVYDAMHAWCRAAAEGRSI